MRESRGGPPSKRASVRAKLLTFVIAVVVAVAGIIGFVLAMKGESVAATFVRVGGPTRVETAVEASRFWLAPPQRVVTAPASATQEVMLGAAQCAMLHDAPLLFTAQNPKQRRLVEATMDVWRRARPGPPARVLEIKVLGGVDVERCLSDGDPSNVEGLLTLELTNDPLDVPFPKLEPDEELAETVVFVAAKAPATVPDVAVGLALAAHMATVDREVSLVIVPRYLQADPALEAQLRKRHLVKSGLVLGQTGILSEDTRAVLRQIITSTDRRAILGEAQDTLRYIGAVIAALAALLGLGAVAGVATQAVPAFVGFVERSRGRPVAPPPGNGPHPKPDGWPAPERSCDVTTHPEGELDWTVGLPDGRRVTVWLRSGWRITGQVKVVADRADAAMRPSFLDLDNAQLEREGDRPRQKAGAEKPGMVRVPVDAIELLLSEDHEKPEEPAST
jgi:hypothetical protein